MTEPTDEARADLAERLERWAEQFAGKSWAKHDVRLLREAARALRSTPEAEALIERLTAVADLLIQMESWNVSHGPLDDPTIGNLIVSARNVIGDPRDLRSTPEAGEGRQVSAEDLARLRRLLNHWDERTPKRTLHGESLARILDALEPAAATTPTSPSRTVTPPSWPATTPPERKGDDD